MSCGDDNFISNFHQNPFRAARPLLLEAQRKEAMRSITNKYPILLIVFCALAACAVRPDDQAAWVGASSKLLDTHPIWSTMKQVRTITDDGVEIRAFVNSKEATPCAAGGDIYKGIIEYEIYKSFMTCMSKFPSCNNIFLVQQGKVKSYLPTPSGGAYCYTDDRTRPDYKGPNNL